MLTSLTPLKNKLEPRPTLSRVCRYIGVQFNVIEWNKLSIKVYSEFLKNNSITLIRRVNQKLIFGNQKYRHKVLCYPSEFIPEMIKIIMEFKNPPIKKKRKRINIGLCVTPVDIRRLASQTTSTKE